MLSLSSKTAASFIQYAQQLVINAIDKNKEIIGEPGIIVEVDKSKFSTHKYHRGRVVASKKWVFGGIERTEERNFFAITVDNREAQTLDAVMRLYIDPGSIIYSDGWRGYIKLVEKGICSQHESVNHSKNYVNHQKSTCTNGIEGQWAVLKQHISKCQRTDDLLDDCLLEEVWRHQNKHKLWEALGYTLATVTYLDDNSNDDIEEQETNKNVVQV